MVVVLVVVVVVVVVVAVLFHIGACQSLEGSCVLFQYQYMFLPGFAAESPESTGIYVVCLLAYCMATYKQCKAHISCLHAVLMLTCNACCQLSACFTVNVTQLVQLACTHACCSSICSMLTSVPLPSQTAVLLQAGVRTMCLPAAHETVHTWIHGFGLQPMPDEDLDAACKDLRMLIFPGTQVLQKRLLPPLPPREGPLMTPPWAEETALPMTTEGQSPAGVAIPDASQAVAHTPHDVPAVRLDTSTGLKGLVTAAAASMREAVGVSTSGEAGSAPSATQTDQSAAGATPAATQDSAPGLQASAPAAFVEPTEVRQDTEMRPAEVPQGHLLGLLHDEGQVHSGEGTAGCGAEAGKHPGEVLQSVDGDANAADHPVMSDEVVDVVSLPLNTSHLQPQVCICCIWLRLQVV